MDFAIASANFTIAVDEYGGIIELSIQVGVTLDDTPAMHDHLVTASLFLQAFDGGTRNCLRRFSKPGIRAQVCPEFGETYELCAHVGGTIQEALYGSQVLSGVITRVKLDNGGCLKKCELLAIVVRQH